MTYSNYAKQIIADTAASIKKAGFRVFLAESGTYGFYTDADGSRVVSFQTDLGQLSFSGNYKTNNPSQTGTGWRLNTQGYADMFNVVAPAWAVRDAKWQYTTLAQHLKTYQSSSKYREVGDEELAA